MLKASKNIGYIFVISKLMCTFATDNKSQSWRTIDAKKYNDSSKEHKVTPQPFLSNFRLRGSSFLYGIKDCQSTRVCEIALHIHGTRAVSKTSELGEARNRGCGDLTPECMCKAHGSNVWNLSDHDKGQARTGEEHTLYANVSQPLVAESSKRATCVRPFCASPSGTKLCALVRRKQNAVANALAQHIHARIHAYKRTHERRNGEYER